MKKNKLYVSGLLILSLLAALCLGAFAAQEEDIKEPAPYYLSFSGTVKEVTPYYGTDGNVILGSYFLLIEDGRGAVVNFVVTPDTYMINGAEPKTGDAATGYYYAYDPAIAIYPPQYRAAVLELNPSDEYMVKVDRFDENLLSADGQLKLNLSEDIEIRSPDGAAFEGDLYDRDLVVLFDRSTRSIPAQTTPIKVIVLPLIEPPVPDVWNMDIVVEGKSLSGAPAACYNADGVVMIPLRAVCEALGREVVWNDSEKSVTVGGSVSLHIGSDLYSTGDETVALGAAPELVDGMTYVPLHFFKTVLGMNNAYVFEGQIVIDNAEVME